MQIPARKAVAQLKEYDSTEQVEWNDYEKVWDET